MIKLNSSSKITGLVFIAKKTILLILAFFSKLSFQKEVTTLLYHSIDSTEDPLAVDPAEFKRQIKYLQKKYAIVSLDAIIDYIEGKRDVPKKAVAITFDDGYHDFYKNVYPYLHKYNLPAAIFVTAGYVGKEWPIGTQHKMLTWKEIEEISKNNIEIGAHTVTHPNMQEIDLKEAENEILGSKKVIEKHIKRKLKYFSYPFGRNTPEIVSLVKSLGFKGAFGGEEAIQKDMKIFALRRVQIDRSVSFLLFKAKLTKAVCWMEKIEGILKKCLKIK
jgi:peptidoglycan/xylan/chitin deacetylase (PgdA/CDA1 family)